MNIAPKLTGLEVSRETAPSRIVSPVDRHVGAKVREARQFRKLTQEAFGDRLQVSFQQVQKYENGSNRISAATLYRIAAELGLSPIWFFEGLDEIAQGERPPVIDSDQRKLLEAFDRIASPPIRRLLIMFIDHLADESGKPT